MKAAFKTLLAATAFVALTGPALAEVVRTETITDTRYVMLKDDISAKNTTNRATGRHYSSQSNEYRQPESLANAQVIALQQDLKTKGFYKGRLDGIMNASTKDAIRDYQQANGLPVTGRMDSAALEQMGIKWDTVPPLNGTPVITGVTKTTTTVRTVE